MKYVQALIHNAVRLSGTRKIYVDPYQLTEDYGDADLVLVTHDHFDHFSPADIARVRKDDTVLVAPLHDRASVLESSGFSPERILFVEPGDTLSVFPAEDGKSAVTVKAIPAYNIGKKFHPKENGWVGYLITADGHTTYVAGDTDVTPELLSVKADYALLPCGGTYTMTLPEAAYAASRMDIFTAIPTHYGVCAGEKTDGYRFNLLYVQNCLPLLQKRLAEMGFPQSVYEETVTDVEAKRAECRRVCGIDGIMHIQNWYGKLLHGEVLRFGRLEFERLSKEKLEKISPESAALLHGTPYGVNVHIPSNGGPLTAEAVEASFKAAYEAFSADFPDGVMKCFCHSWLLYPENRTFLPPESNLVKFADRFTLIGTEEQADFKDAWRVFGAKAFGPVSDYPEETALQRAMKAYLLSGGRMGMGRGYCFYKP